MMWLLLATCFELHLKPATSCELACFHLINMAKYYIGVIFHKLFRLFNTEVHLMDYNESHGSFVKYDSDHERAWLIQIIDGSILLHCCFNSPSPNAQRPVTPIFL